MNCKVGGLHIEDPNVAGKHNNIERGHNDRGKTFVNFCKQNNVSIANTQFKHRREYTWISPGDRVRNTIDFICVRKPAMKFIKDAHLLSIPDISDHRLVRCKMSFSFLCNKKYKNNISRFNANLLSDHAVLDAYQRAKENNLPLLPNDDVEANEIFHHIKSAVNEASKNVLGKKPTNTERDWITPETLAQIHQKHEIRRQFGSKSVEYKLSKSICKKLCRIDKQKHIDKIHLDINSLPNSVKYFIAMKKLKNTNERNIKSWSIKSKSGEVITERDKLILRWHEFYSKLYHCDRQVLTSYEESTPILSTTPSEIENALKKLNKSKSPGPDNITSELLIAGGPVLQTWLKFLIDSIL